MKFGQALKMAFRSILGNKGRSFLTMLGIIIGIASVMTIVSVVTPLKAPPPWSRCYFTLTGTLRKS